MKIKFKGVYTIEEHLLILNRLKHENKGTWEVSRTKMYVPSIKIVEH